MKALVEARSSAVVQALLALGWLVGCGGRSTAHLTPGSAADVADVADVAEYMPDVGGSDATGGKPDGAPPPSDDASSLSDAALSDEASTATADAADASDGDGGGYIVDASTPGCLIVVESPPLLPGTHVPIGSTIQWDSNPPSSGPHYPVWAAYQAYSSPVPRGYYVHDLEHGAIVFLYKCGDAGCPDVVNALQQAVDSLPPDQDSGSADPLCVAAAEGVRVRAVITPDPLIDVPVAAAAWGWTYKAFCIDLPSLEAFAAAHYGQGPEQTCVNGTTQF